MEEEAVPTTLGPNCGALPPPAPTSGGAAISPSISYAPSAISADDDAAAAAMVALASAAAEAAASSAPSKPPGGAAADGDSSHESESEGSFVACEVIGRSDSYGSTTVQDESPMSALSMLSAAPLRVALSPPSAHRTATGTGTTQLSPAPEASVDEDADGDDDSSADATTSGVGSPVTGSPPPGAAALGVSASPFSLNRQVSCQGCSRAFIINVLRRACECVKGKALPSIFTFKKKLVQGWLLGARDACSAPSYPAEEAYFGGPPFCATDASTHWFEPHQFYTWWKNNIERKSKFRVLIHDSFYSGYDSRQLSRAHWCAAVVALSEIIRRSSGSHNNHLKGRKTKALSQERVAALEAIEGVPYCMPGADTTTPETEKDGAATDEKSPNPTTEVESSLDKFHAKYLDFIGEMMRLSPNVAASIGAGGLLVGDLNMKRVIGADSAMSSMIGRKPSDSYPFSLASGVPPGGNAPPSAYSNADMVLSNVGLQAPVGAYPYRPMDAMRIAGPMNSGMPMQFHPNANPQFAPANYGGQIAPSSMMFSQSSSMAAMGHQQASMYPRGPSVLSGQSYPYMPLVGNTRDQLVYLPGGYPGYHHQEIAPLGTRPFHVMGHNQYLGGPQFSQPGSGAHSSGPFGGYVDRGSSSLPPSAAVGNAALRPHAMMGNMRGDLNWIQNASSAGFTGSKDFLPKMSNGTMGDSSIGFPGLAGYYGTSNTISRPDSHLSIPKSELPNNGNPR